MTDHQIDPSEEPTAPLPPIDTPTPVAETAYAPAPVYDAARSDAAPHHATSTGVAFAAVAAGAFALLFAFAAGWASHGMATRVALRGMGPGARVYALRQAPGGFAGRAGRGTSGCPALRRGVAGSGTDGGDSYGGDAPGGYGGRGSMMQRGWQQSPDQTTPGAGTGQVPGYGYPQNGGGGY